MRIGMSPLDFIRSTCEKSALNFSATQALTCDLPGPAEIAFDLETGQESAVLDGSALTLPPYAIVILNEVK